MDRLLNFTTVTPATAAITSLDSVNKGKIHVRTQQMGKKWLTTIEGLDDDLDLERIARAMKKSLHCAASVERDKNDLEIIKLQGNQRDLIREWLVSSDVITEKEAKERLVVHGV
jgi:translation initiation factor 1